MEKPELIVTVGNSLEDNYNNFFEILIENNLKYFRFNLSKHENLLLLKKRIGMIRSVCETYKDIKIMIDIPFPGKKPRIELRNACEKVYKDDIIFITSEKKIFSNKKNKVIYVDVDSIGEKVNKSEELIYSNGECSFHIIDILNDHALLAKVNNSQTLYNRKSLWFGYIDKNNFIDNDYLNLIKSIKVDSVALSFVSASDEVLIFQNYFSEQNIISKIESQEAVQNIDDIAKYSDVMLARGDLLLNSDYCNLYNNQINVATSCQKNDRNLYIATGILSSVINGLKPSQADIIDISNLLLLKPNYLILNYSLTLNNYKSALQIINRVYEYVKYNQTS